MNSITFPWWLLTSMQVECAWEKLGWNPPRYAYLCRHNLIGIRRARELGGRKMELSVTVSSISMEIHSFIKHSFKAYVVPSPCQAQWGTGRQQKPAYNFADTCIWNTVLKRTEHSILLRQHLRQAWGKMVQMQSIHVKGLGFFVGNLHNVPNTHLAHRMLVPYLPKILLMPAPSFQ